MERLLFVWDELDDWSGIAQHYVSGALDSFSIHSFQADAVTVLLCLPFLVFG
jgi:hypothetical protein